MALAGVEFDPLLFEQSFVPLHFEPSERQVSPELEAYDHILMLGNPLKRYEEARDYHYQRLLVRGNEHGFRLDSEATSPTLKGNEATLSSIGRSTILAVVGGDGTASLVMRAAYELGIDNPFMILDGGNAINQGRMHHHERKLDRPERILSEGQVRDVHPILVTAESPGGIVQHRVAFAYATFGMTALATAGFNTPEHRTEVDGASKRKRFIEEAKTTLQARKDTVPFDIHEADRPTRTRAELAYVSGKLMAKFLRFPSDLFDEEAVVVEAADTRLRTIGSAALSLALPFARGRHEWLRPGQEHAFRLSTPDGSPLHAELDGDARTDPSDTSYAFQISEKSVKVITSRNQENFYQKLQKQIAVRFGR